MAGSQVAERIPQPWDGFQLGPENALAHGAILALARGQREGLSPIVLYGPSGTGKSRLLQALVQELLLRQPGASLALLTAEEFAAACAEAMTRPGGWSELRDRFRALDLLALDDLLALEKTPLALNELAHTLDALAEADAAAVVTARTGPSEWSGLPRRLVSRLTGGLVVKLERPGLEARRRYVLDQARERGLSLTAEAVDRLADTVESYPAIAGLLARMTLEARLDHRPLDRTRMDGVLDEPGSQPNKVLIDHLAQAVAARFGLRLRELRSASRRAAVVAPRHLAMHLARAYCGLSFAAIGAYFGHRDPATVRHACARAAERLATDPALAALAASIVSSLPR